MSRCYLKVGYYGQLFINVGAASGLIQNYIFISGFFFYDTKLHYMFKFKTHVLPITMLMLKM